MTHEEEEDKSCAVVIQTWFKMDLLYLAVVLKIRNEEIGRRVNMQPAEQTANKIRWWSHVKRMAPTAPQRKALVIQPVGKRPKGRPPNRWEDDIPKWYNEMWMPMTEVKKLGEGQTSDCISTRRRWQKSLSKIK